MEDRKVRFKKGEVPKTEEKKKTRPPMGPSKIVETVVTLKDEKAMAKFAKTLTEDEIASIIGWAAEVDSALKRQKNRVDVLKLVLLEAAKAGKWKEKEGLNGGRCQIKAKTQTTMGSPTEFAKLLKAEGKIHLFDETVSVLVGKAKEYLGVDALEGFISVDTEEYGSVSLKIVKEDK